MSFFFNFLFLFGGRNYSSGRQMQEDWEMNGIGVYAVQFPKNFSFLTKIMLKRRNNNNVF